MSFLEKKKTQYQDIEKLDTLIQELEAMLNKLKQFIIEMP